MWDGAEFVARAGCASDGAELTLEQAGAEPALGHSGTELTSSRTEPSSRSARTAGAARLR